MSQSSESSNIIRSHSIGGAKDTFVASGRHAGHAKKPSEVSLASTSRGADTVYSDSDCDSLSEAPSMQFSASGVALRAQPSGHAGGKQKKRKNQPVGWDVLTTTVDPNKGDERCPPKHEGYMFKRRRFPLKGWHKRWYICEAGDFICAKSPEELKSYGRFYGRVDLGNSFISYKRSRRRIHIDAGSIVHHVRCKRQEDFERWIEQLSRHRRYSQSNPNRRFKDGATQRQPDVNADIRNRTLTRNGSLPESALPEIHSQFANAMQSVHVEDTVIVKFKQLQGIIADVEKMLSMCSQFSGATKAQKQAADSRPSSGISGDAGAPSSQLLSSSNPNLVEQPKPPWSGYDSRDLADTLAQFLRKVRAALELLRSVSAEMGAEMRPASGREAAESGPPAQEAAQLSARLAELQRENLDLRTRLQIIHGHSDMSGFLRGHSDMSSLLRGHSDMSGLLPLAPPMPTTLASSLSHDSVTEYHDAAERLSLEASSSESEDDLTDDKDDDEEDVGRPATSVEVAATTGRRETLPVPQPDTGSLNLFNILCRNIGKDLTSVRMPIAFNEPLSALQRLCEEIEYSHLLDQAAESKDPLERLVLVSAFAVSGYAFVASRSKKPFNPLLAETFECIREDKGWKFVAEQVSHHPPVCASHCESGSWELQQDCRLRNKFWGKSLEATPIGSVRLRFKADGALYTWNKVTTCIYNLFNSSRYIDHYGELCVQGAGSQARITFHKGGSVSGVCKAGGRDTAVFGRWCESLLAGREHTARCVWRSGALPPHSASYYGFTRFAIELNELPQQLAPLLPRTDTRFRPDQRLLENGELDKAECEKLRLEAKQRSRATPLKPLWFEQSGKNWQFGQRYWACRAERFAGLSLPDLFGKEQQA